MTVTDFTLRLAAAALAGLAIGFERQLRQKTAGLKTNMLVASGAAIFVLLSYMIKNEDATVDVTRIIAQVITGVGFLGAGVIFREGVNVHGLGSAATIWCSAAIGCIAATGFYKETAICTILILLINLTIEPLDKWLKGRR